MEVLETYRGRSIIHYSKYKCKWNNYQPGEDDAGYRGEAADHEFLQPEEFKEQVKHKGRTQLV